MLFLLNYIKIGIWSTIYYYNPSEIIVDIIIKNIKSSGPVLIKLTQWILPKIESFYELDDKMMEKIKKIEVLYENCNFHSLEYTEKVYEEEFNELLLDQYKEIQEISSGSIGQVYKLTRNDGKVLALKILHPNTEFQINFYKILFKVIKNIGPLKRYINYYFPIDLETFIKDFQLQTNFINEANNNLIFSDIYKNNPNIIIPRLQKVSKKMLLMDYEEGTIYDKKDFSEYLSWKIISLIKLFNKNNETIYNFMHGDLHKANWKVRVNKTDIKLIIYDFGFCWKIPKSITNNLVFMNKTMMDIQISNIDGIINEELQKKLVKVCSIFIEYKISSEIISDQINTLILNVSPTDPLFFLKLLLNCSRISNIVLDSYILGCIIGHNQMSNLYKVVFEDNFYEDDDKKNERFIFSQYFSDLINFCETNNIFLDYIDYLKNEVNIEMKSRNIKNGSLFMINKEIEENDFIKKLCIPP